MPSSAPSMSKSEPWPDLPVARLGLPVGHGIVEAVEQLGGMAQRAQRVHLDERLEDALVDEAQVDARAEVGQRGEVAARLAGRR